MSGKYFLERARELYIERSAGPKKLAFRSLVYDGFYDKMPDMKEIVNELKAVDLDIEKWIRSE